ncbi:MAG: twin-arginine translocase TatA/TatE family subunit [Blastocatellia bacterium]
MSEIMIIMVIALVVFGPRKLPDLGKQLGQMLAQFRRASDDFKRTWEQEVDLEKVRTLPPGSTDSHTASGTDSSGHDYDPYNSDSSYHYNNGDKNGDNNGDDKGAAGQDEYAASMETSGMDTLSGAEPAVAQAVEASPAPKKDQWI